MNRIAVITTSFPDREYSPGQEAAGAFVFDFVEELSRHVEVSVIAPSVVASVDRFDRFEVHRFKVPFLPLSLLVPTNPAHWPKILSTLRAGQRLVEEVVQRKRFDHIFSLWVLPSGYWAKRAAQRSCTPHSVWALGSDIWNLGKIPFVKSVLKSVLEDSQFRFADGYQLAADVETLSGLECRFLPSARQLRVTGEKQLAASPPFRLAFLGRWHPHKGVDLLLESLLMLADNEWQRINSVRICGGGPLEDLVHEQCEKLQKTGRPVRVSGYLNRQEARELLLWADYLLLPSRIESIPIIFSDAMQAQLPVISTPVGDLSRLIAQYEVGVVATSVSSAAFCIAIRQALRQRPNTFATGLVAAQTDFSVAASVRRFIESLTPNVI